MFPIERLNTPVSATAKGLIRSWLPIGTLFALL
jgi:hypothetical protein